MPLSSILRRCTIAGVAILLAGCAGGGGETEEDGETTSGRRVSFATTVAPPPSLTFTNEEGWSVEVRRALVSVGALHYFSGEPIEGELAEEATLRGSLRWLGGLVVGTAHAHPGHYAEGDARGEMLTPASVDLVAGATSLAAGEGITGLVRSARFTWGTTPSGAFAGDLGDAVVHVEGRATRDDEERWFILRARADQLPDGDVAVDGCIFDRAEVEGDGTVTLTVDPAVWLAGADFADAEPGAEGAPVQVADGVQPSNAFLRGLQRGGAYRFGFVAQ